MFGWVRKLGRGVKSAAHYIDVVELVVELVKQKRGAPAPPKE